MDKLKINLIPPEIKERAKKEAKRTLLVRISVGLLGVLILVTSGILAVIVLQNALLQSLNTELERNKTEIGSLKEKEAVVFFLKNRIDTINRFSKTSYKQGETYELISNLTPEGIELSYLQIDKTENVGLQGETNTTAALNIFFTNLMDPAKNEGKISSVSVESLSRSQDGRLIFDLKITMSAKAI